MTVLASTEGTQELVFPGSFADDLIRATEMVVSNPEAALGMLDGLWRQASSAETMRSPSERPLWLDVLLSIAQAKWTAYDLLGRVQDQHTLLKTVERLLEGQPAHAFHIDLVEWRASLANDFGARLDLLDQAFEYRRESGEVEKAVRNRARAAVTAGMGGHTGKMRRLWGAAIDLAKSASLHRLELACRRDRFRFLLANELDGTAIGELRRELDYTVDLRGDLCGETDRAFVSCFVELAASQATIESGGDIARHLQDAARTATSFSLRVCATRFRALADTLRKSEVRPDPATLGEVKDAILAALSQLQGMYRSDRIALFVLAAHLKVACGDPDTSLEVLRQALSFPSVEVADRCSVLGALVDVHLRGGELAAALEHAEGLVAEAELSALPALKAQAHRKREEVRFAALALASHPSSERLEGPMQVIAEAQKAIENRRQPLAIELCSRQLADTTDPLTRRLLLVTRAIASLELQQTREAIGDAEASLAILAEEFAADQTHNDRRIIEEESTAAFLAFCYAAIGDRVAAWEWLERGRARAFKTENGVVAAGWPATRRWLQANRVGVVIFARVRWGMLCVTAGPRDEVPSVEIGPGLDEVSAIYAQDGTAARTEHIVRNAGAFSEKVLRGCSARIQEVASFSNHLHVLPESDLFELPLPALEFASGMRSIDIVPMATAFSVDYLCGSGSPTIERSQLRCLSVAVGRDQTGFDFAEHPLTVHALNWPRTPVLLSGDLATAASFRELAPDCEAIYVAAHGEFSSGNSDQAASSIVLASGERLTAGAVAGWKLRPGLVFLNVCQAGRFKRVTRTEIGGFPRAFLQAGMRTVIAPLSHVEPKGAAEFARLFFAAWLGGKGAVQAFSAAQRAYRDCGGHETIWASYSIYGDAFV